MIKRKQVAVLISAMILGTVTAAGALASPNAAPESKSKVSSWDHFDTDKDGMINKKEAGAMQGLAQLFDKIDANKDGQLDKGELSAIHGGGHGHGHGDAHSNGHGDDSGHPHEMDKDHGAGHMQGT